MIVAPPVALAVNATLAWGEFAGLPPTFAAEDAVGAWGTDRGVAEDEVESVLVPLVLVAVTV